MDCGMTYLWAECLGWKTAIFVGVTTFYFLFTLYLILFQIPISKRNIQMDKEEIRRFTEKKREGRRH